jgi:hypothetical protein
MKSEAVKRTVTSKRRASNSEGMISYHKSEGQRRGYAPEMAWHILEGHKPEHKEVELVTGLATTIATYLSR